MFAMALIQVTDVRDSELFSTWGAAELLHCSPTTVRRYIRDGALKAGQERKHWRISGKQLKAFVARVTKPAKGKG